MAEEKKSRGISLSHTFFHRLLVIMAVSFLVSFAFTWVYLTNKSRNNAETMLRTNVQDVKKDLNDLSDDELLKKAWDIAFHIDAGAPTDPEGLKKLMYEFDVAEINVIDKNGIVIASTAEKLLNYDMSSGEQSAEFLKILKHEVNEYVQSYRPTDYDPSISMKYAAAFLYNDGFVQAGYNGRQIEMCISNYITGVARNRHVGKDGCMIIANDYNAVVSDSKGYVGKKLQDTGLDIDRDSMPENKVFKAEVYGENASSMYIYSEGYYIISVLPEKEIIQERIDGLLVMGIAEILIFCMLFIVVYLLVKRKVVDRIALVNCSLARITEGDLNEVVDVRSNMEFDRLSDGINSTVDTLKRYIREAAARIDEELEFAKNIQQSALPSVFPPYPDRKDFAIYASMDAAKEVGGDFYDFYLRDENRISFLIGDVSGKGIPAAMFMMTAKTMLRDYAERGDKLSEVFGNVNDKLCEENDANMFLTAWMGELDTETGMLRFVNAGHTRPVLIRGGKASFISQEANLMLAMLEGIPYQEECIKLEPGDFIYLYTDGVTEASNTDKGMFGEERLPEILSEDFGTGEEACRRIITKVRGNVDAFVQNAPQFDDITQLCVWYRG